MIFKVDVIDISIKRIFAYIGYKISVISLIVLISSCSLNYQHIKVSGVVLSSDTGLPIHLAEVNVTCWIYDIDIWESREIHAITETNKRGEFTVLFEEGEAIDIVISKPGFQGFQSSFTLSRNRLNKTFKMEK